MPPSPRRRTSWYAPSFHSRMLLVPSWLAFPSDTSDTPDTPDTLRPRIISPVTTSRYRRRRQGLVAPLLPIALYRSTEESLTEMARQYHISFIRRKGGLLVLCCGSRSCPLPRPLPASGRGQKPEERGITSWM